MIAPDVLVHKCLASVILLLLAACHHKDPAEELRKTERSWQATLALVAAEEKKHNVPPVYVKQVREAAAKSLEKARQEAAK